MTTQASTSYGRPDCKIAVWNKAAQIRGRDPNKWRTDLYNNTICFKDHGKSTKYGWDIDHYIPKAKVGSDHIDNLHPVQSSKNRSMGMKMGDKDKLLWFQALMLGRGDENTNPPPRTKFKYVVGSQVLARQTPVGKTQLAIIESVDSIRKKIGVYWVCGGYREKIEMYDGLFMNMKERRCAKCPTV